MKKLLLIPAIILTISLLFAKDKGFKSGDIVFQDSTSSQSKAIKLATHSKYSHVGIIYIKNGKTYVFEAIGPVVYTPIEEWILHGANQKYDIKRLKDSSVLTPDALNKMKTIAKTFQNRPYDALFGWSDNRIYCSELVWKIYKRALGIELGKLKKLKSFDLSHPAVKAKLKERYGDKIPLNEDVIAPQGIFESDLLISVD